MNIEASFALSEHENPQDYVSDWREAKLQCSHGVTPNNKDVISLIATLRRMSEWGKKHIWWDHMTSWAPFQPELFYDLWIYDFREQTGWMHHENQRLKIFLAYDSLCSSHYFLHSFYPPLQTNFEDFLSWDLWGKGQDLWDMEVSWQVCDILFVLAALKLCQSELKDFPPSAVRSEEK